MTLEEFEAGYEPTEEERERTQAAIYAIQDAIADIELEFGEGTTNAAFFIIADAWDEDARAAMN